MSLHHLLRWVDEGIAPPRAPRILLDRDESNDGSTMVLDAHGNPVGGIRSPYVDVPTAKYAPVNTAADPVIANPSEYVRVNGLQGAQTMCRLSAYQEPFSAAKLRELYGSKREYLRKFETRLDELETRRLVAARVSRHDPRRRREDRVLTSSDCAQRRSANFARSSAASCSSAARFFSGGCPS